jgi:hypothetical protein
VSGAGLIAFAENEPHGDFVGKACGRSAYHAGGFEPAASSADPIARRSNQVVWRDPGSGYVRRNVSPSSPLTPIQIVMTRASVISRISTARSAAGIVKRCPMCARAYDTQLGLETAWVPVTRFLPEKL